VEFRAFADEHVDGAAAGLATRHAEHRAVETLLPECGDFAAQVRTEREDATGAVALEGGAVVGFLLGRRREDRIGPHVWSYVAGQAVRDPELVRDLYTLAADRWVAEGLTRHFVYVPAIPALVEPWLRSSFGISAALAARETAPAATASAAADVRGETSAYRPAASTSRTRSPSLRCGAPGRASRSPSTCSDGRMSTASGR
jgi:hypothetical protein